MRPFAATRHLLCLASTRRRLLFQLREAVEAERGWVMGLRVRTIVIVTILCVCGTASRSRADVAGAADGSRVLSQIEKAVGHPLAPGESGVLPNTQLAVRLDGPAALPISSAPVAPQTDVAGTATETTPGVTSAAMA